MKPVLLGAISFLVLLCPPRAVGDSSLNPRYFEGGVNNEFAHFSFWSSVLDRGDDGLEAEYAVCNYAATALNFTWAEPNISVGKGGKLPREKCFIYKRPAIAIDHDLNARMLYTQAKRIHAAPAHVPALPLPVTLLPARLTHLVRIFYAPTSASPTMADLTYSETRQDGEVRYQISWRPPKVVIAVSSTVFSGSDADQARQAAVASGLSVERGSLREYLQDSELDELGGDRANAEVLFLRRGADADAEAVFDFTVKGETGGVSNVQLTVINTETNEMIFDVPITTYSP
ncbi:hypothetical protein [Arvimicrobium flavum]|uniref:hypothetical protein n=1 Tax=Arvimicrobium flavum TaxID=3393320 RepID=UPI00237AC9F6|nr:hypothetical protein [Mesorhizobium shangrilense]